MLKLIFIVVIPLCGRRRRILLARMRWMPRFQLDSAAGEPVLVNAVAGRPDHGHGSDLVPRGVWLGRDPVGADRGHDDARVQRWRISLLRFTTTTPVRRPGAGVMFADHHVAAGTCRSDQPDRRQDRRCPDRLDPGQHRQGKDRAGGAHQGAGGAPRRAEGGIRRPRERRHPCAARGARRRVPLEGHHLGQGAGARRPPTTCPRTSGTSP